MKLRSPRLLFEGITKFGHKFLSTNDFTRTAWFSEVKTWIMWIPWIAPHSAHHHPDHSRPDRSDRSNWTYRYISIHIEHIWTYQTDRSDRTGTVGCQTCQRLHVLEPMHRPVILWQKLAMHSWQSSLSSLYALWLSLQRETRGWPCPSKFVRPIWRFSIASTSWWQIFYNIIRHSPANIIKYPHCTLML